MAVVNGPGYSYEATCKGAEVVFKKVNATGGINGRKINYVGCLDDGGVSSNDNAQTTRLIEQDKVFAIVPASVVFSGSSIAAKANIPYFGWGISPYYCDNSQGFGFNGCTGPSNPNWVNGVWAKLALGLVPGAKTAGQQSLDIPPGRANAAGIGKGITAAGLKLVYNDGTLPLAGVSDYTPYVQRIVRANPDVLFLEMQNVIPMVATLKAAGYKGATFDAVDYNPALLSNAATKQALNGEYVLTEETPFSDTSNPGIAQLISDTQKYGDPGQVIDDTFAQGYFSASMFVDMLTKAGPNLTSQSFYQVANNSGYCFNANGALGNICFPKGHTDQSGCQAMVQVVNGQFVQKAPMTCAAGPGNNGGQKS